MQHNQQEKTVVLAPFSGVVRDLVDVPDLAFAKSMLGDGLAIDPLDELVAAPFPGVILAVAPTGHSVTIRSEEGVELLIHIGLDTVNLQHKGFTLQVEEGQQVDVGTPLISFDLDYIAAHAKDCVTPIIIVSHGAEMERRASIGPIRAGEELFLVRTAAAERSPAELVDATTAHIQLTVALPHGIHARPAARISRFARGHDACITLSAGERSAEAGSTTELMKLGVACGDELAIRVVGADARQVALDLAALLADMAEAEAATVADPAPAISHTENLRALAASERRGVRAAPGLATGSAFRLLGVDRDISDDATDAGAERGSLVQALAQLRGEIAAIMAGGTPVARQIAEAHLAVLEDHFLLAEAERLIAGGKSAAGAWRAASRRQEDDLRATGNDRLLERAIDFRDVERRLISLLCGDGGQSPLAAMPQGAILLCDDVQPSLLMEHKDGQIAAICCAHGGATSHAAILAAAAGIPMIVSLGDDILATEDGRDILVDADNALVDLDPSAEAQTQFAARISEAAAVDARAAETALQDCLLADGTRIEVFANLTSEADAIEAVAKGAEGCGLLRTEFLFSERETAPTEAEQANILQAIAAALQSRPLIIRTLDVGGDKPLPYFPFDREENPALGMRGVRFTLQQRDVLRTQLRAMLAAVPPEALRIMVPMIVDTGELAAVRAMLDEVVQAMGITGPIPLGIMVETPAAAFLSGHLAQEADFFSIGSNDLSQYVLAMDRGNSALAERVDACHPAVLHAIAQTARGAAEHQRWLGICGGLASEPDAAPLLVGLGCVELSVVPRAIPSIKDVLRRWTGAECRALAQQALTMNSASEVRQLLAGARK